MPRLVALLLFAALGTDTLAAQNSAEAINTPRGVCAVWAMPMGGSSFPKDASYSRCALDRAPIPSGTDIQPPIPLYGGHTGGSIRVIVNADGSVDRTRTRFASISGDEDDAYAMLDHVLRWRFDPGMREGLAVRSAIDLDVRTDRRPADTLPARLEWRYVSGWEHDSLVGRWVPAAAVTPYTFEQTDRVHIALLRRLSEMGVVQVTNTRSYCVATADNSTRFSRIRRVARAVQREIPRLGTDACADAPDRVRLLLPRVHRTENDRVVLSMTGSQLPRWPTGFEARAWDRWTARCVGTVRGEGDVALRCDVSPIAPYAETSQWYGNRRQTRTPPRAQRADSEPVQLAVLATMTGAYGIDTLRTHIARVPRLSVIAQTDSIAAFNYWMVWSPDARDTAATIVHGQLAEGRLWITQAQTERQSPDTSLSALDIPNAPRAQTFVALLLAGVGARPRAPLTICYGPCDRRYTLQAERHVIEPQLRFRVSSLREISRSARGQLELRVHVDPLPDGLLPLLVLTNRDTKQSTAWILRDLGGGVWDWNVSYAGDDIRSQDISVFVVRK